MTGSYIVLELQTTGGVTSNIINAYTTSNEADNAYYNALAAAAISSVEIHSIMLITPRGETLRSDYYKHKVESVEPTE